MNSFPITLNRPRKMAAWIYWAAQMLAISVLVRSLSEIYADKVSPGVFQFSYLALNFTVLTCIFAPFLTGSFRLFLKSPWNTLRSAFLGYLLYYLTQRIFGSLQLWLLPGFQNYNDASIAALSQDTKVLTAIGTLILAPVAEELIHRGLIFGTLYEVKPWLGYTVSAAVFSGLHILGYLGRYTPYEFLFAFLQYACAGLCLCFAYDRSKNIWTPILMHIAINQIAILSLR